MEFRYTHAGQTLAVDVERAGDDWIVSLDGQRWTVSGVNLREGQLTFELDGAPRRAWVAADGPRRWVALAGDAARPWLLETAQASQRARRKHAGGHEDLEAQMPGVVRRVLVQAGQAVVRGEALLLMEAMKMEIRVSAPFAGVVERVAVAEGQAVERGQALVALAEQE